MFQVLQDGEESAIQGRLYTATSFLKFVNDNLLHEIEQYVFEKRCGPGMEMRSWNLKARNE